MEVVYLFYESGCVRIPYFGYNNQLFKLIVSQGGKWESAQHSFIIMIKTAAEQISQIFHDYPCVLLDEHAQLRIFSFFERPWWEETEGPRPFTETPCKLISGSAVLGSLSDNFSKSWQAKLEAELRSRKYSLKTLRAYIYYNRFFCSMLQKTPEEIEPEDITKFLAIVEKDREYSASSMNLAISAIKFFYKNILKDESISEQHRPHQDGKLPKVLAKSEVCKILNMEKNPKHHLLLMLVYSSGLRVSEVVTLKREDIDIARKVINIRLSKGRKDRCTVLSEKASDFITEYCSLYSIKTWLFPGQNTAKHLSIRSAQYIFDKALRRAEISKNISIHSLRHTFATHLLESGTDIRYIQALLGHSNLRTTERYTHIARRSILNIKSPLDTLS